MSEREKLLAKENISDEFAQKKGKEYQKLPMHEGDSKSSQSHWESEVSQNVFTPKEAIDYLGFGWAQIWGVLLYVWSLFLGSK